MTRPVLDVVNVSKRYTTYSSNLQRFANWFGAGIAPASSYAAIDDVSFNVRRGESVAIIGQNGAGKSTILKIVTGITRPTSGHVSVAGRVSAVLELGLGFNPEFTGRQNIFHAGGLMGFSQAELAAMMPDVEDFSELGAFFDQPLRVYSSGMHARLAFALATARRPDVLIVDEVLAVGDSYFQHKSFSRIRQFREEGTSIILVTHAMSDVRQLCDRVILLDKGKVLKDGTPDEVVDYYNAMIAEKENAKLSIEQRRRKDGWLNTEYGDRAVTLESIDLFRLGSGEPISVARVGEELEVRTRLKINAPVAQLVIGHRISDRTGHVVWGTNTFHTRQIVETPEIGTAVQSTFRFKCDLGPGTYALTFGLHRDDTHVSQCYHRIENALIFDVINTEKPYFIGTTHLDGEFEVVTKQ